MKKRYTEEQKRQKVEEIQQLIESGLTVEQACKEMDLSDASFYSYKKEFKLSGFKKRKKNKLKVIEMPEIPLGKPSRLAPLGTPSRLAVVFGSVSEISEVLRNLI